MLDILYEDEAVIVVKKPAGVDSQASRGFGADMVSLLQNYLADRQRAAGLAVTAAPYVAVVHRLDKPVSGVMVYAKTRQAAADLSRQLQASAMSKTYFALVCGRPACPAGIYEDKLLQDRRANVSRIVPPGDPEEKAAKTARLRYQVINPEEDMYGTVLQALRWEPFLREQPLTLVRIELLTGRHHQIRVQMAGHGTPLYGDARYHPSERRGGRSLALCAWALTFQHPTDKRNMSFEYSGRNIDGET